MGLPILFPGGCMENNIYFRFGDEVYYIFYEYRTKKYNYAKGIISGQIDFKTYKIKNIKLDLEEKVNITKIYRHLPNCIMDVGLLNMEMK